jgi:hypothetical protein
LLVGNLEVGPIADSGTKRQGTVVLRRRHLGMNKGAYLLRSIVNDDAILPVRFDEEEIVFDFLIQPHGSQIYKLAEF